MKKRKRLLAAVLAASMVLSLGTTAWAEEDSSAAPNTATADEDSENKADIAVNGQYVSELKSDPIISVNVAWTDMNFQYAASQQGTWDPKSHTYMGAVEEGKWLKDSASITVTNHSNEGILANLSYAQTDTGVTGTFDQEELSLANAAEGDSLNDPSKAPSETVEFKVSGAMGESSEDLGTITVSIEQEAVLDLTEVATSDYAVKIQDFVSKNKVTKLKMTLGTSSVKDTQVNAIKEGCNAAGVTAIAILDVTSVEYKAFYDWSEVTSISLPEVTSIATYSFYKLNHLTTLELPKLTTTTGLYAIDTCIALKELNLPELTITVGRLVYGCTALETLNLPKLTSVGGDYTFVCSALKSVNLPELIDTVEGMFSRCIVLENIELPKVTDIAEQMFGSCTSLKHASFPAATSIDKNAFLNCNSMDTLSFGTVLTSVDEKAFNGIKNTSNVTLKLNQAQTAVNDKELTWGEGGTFNGYTFKEIIASN